MNDKGFNLFTGNRLEHLARALATVLERPLSHPFIPERIVVQSGGMGRWLSLEIAKLAGISANMDYSFPNECVYHLLSKYCPETTDYSPYDPHIMAWNIFAWLPELAKQPDFEPILHYLSGTGGMLKRYQLARRIADTFDQYAVFRPDMIHRWGEGKETHWQARLWRYIVSRLGERHRVALFDTFQKAIRNLSEHDHRLPQRISIFGISALPKFHMDVFNEISRFCQVNLFLLNPCREFWGDILSDREEVRVRRKGGAGSSEELHLNTGNDLLASMGLVGRDFFDLVYLYGGNEFPLFDPPQGETMLSAVQSDIFYLKDAAGSKRNIGPDDRSIDMHSCHSPLREVEVLHDRLYDMFDRDPELKPRDILVMMPDVEAYAPFIHAVFGRFSEGRERIPFSLADRGFNRVSRIAETFLALIDLKQSRLTVNEMFYILESDAVRDAFGIESDDLEPLEAWVKDTHIRWGLDGKHRGMMDLPSFNENTWKAGLTRMILGYALPLGRDGVFLGIAPYDAVEGQNAERLGAFLDYMEQVRAWVLMPDDPVSPDAWARRLHELVDRFFARNEENQHELQILRDEITLFSDLPGKAGVDTFMDYSVMRYALGLALEKREHGYGFITGGVTFCAMLPMRSIPFKVIGMLGMQSDAYPRQTRAPGFDLIAKHPRPGDRSRRNDDRYIFLEALISARKTLYISYTGRSIRDNSPVEPSVLVSELMDYLEATFDFEGTSVRGRLLTEHPLQPFSLKYFDGKDCRLFSYSRENFRAARQSLEQVHGEGDAPFFTGPLGHAPECFSHVDVRDFIAFFKHPSRHLLEKRLGLKVDGGADMYDSEEPFTLNGLDRYRLETQLVEDTLWLGPERDMLAFARSSGVLPMGKTGDRAFESVQEEARAFAKAILAHCPYGEKTLRDVDVTVNGIRIGGSVETDAQGRIMCYRPALFKALDFIDIWVNHLVLCVSSKNKGQPSLLFGMEKHRDGTRDWAVRAFRHADSAKMILESLVDLYKTGLHEPLPFFPETSLAFYEYVYKKDKDPLEALIRATQIWQGDDYRRGEAQDAYFDLCFRGKDPLTEAFMDYAKRFYMPLFDHMMDVPEGSHD